MHHDMMRDTFEAVHRDAGESGELRRRGTCSAGQARSPGALLLTVTATKGGTLRSTLPSWTRRALATGIAARRKRT